MNPGTVILLLSMALVLFGAIHTYERLLAQTRAEAILWEIEAKDTLTGARDALKASQRIIPAVPLTVQQATQNSANFQPTRHSLLSRLRDWNNQDSWQEFFNTYWKLIYGAAIRAGAC